VSSTAPFDVNKTTRLPNFSVSSHDACMACLATWARACELVQYQIVIGLSIALASSNPYTPLTE
jgi:hypothetical protein